MGVGVREGEVSGLGFGVWVGIGVGVVVVVGVICMHVYACVCMCYAYAPVLEDEDQELLGKHERGSEDEDVGESIERLALGGGVQGTGYRVQGRDGLAVLSRPIGIIPAPCMHACMPIQACPYTHAHTRMPIHACPHRAQSAHWDHRC